MTDDSIDLNPRELLSTAGVAEITSIVPVSGGWDTKLWRVEYDSRSSALRVYPAGREASWRTELMALEAAAGFGIPVPVVRAQGIWRERPWLLLSWSFGVTLQEALFQSPDQAGPLGVAFGRTQARLHQIRIEPSSTADEPLRRWFTGIEVWTELAERLRRASLSDDRLLHLDYHPLNVLVADGEVTAVLDWANARRGDPRADLARTRTILRFARMVPGGGSDLRSVLTEFEAGWMQGYRAIAGPIGPMPLFDAWAAQLIADDLSPKIGQPGVWLTEAQLAVLRRRAVAWARRAGIGPYST